jgi:uncharacterized protein (TIGR04255 family)
MNPHISWKRVTVDENAPTGVQNGYLTVDRLAWTLPSAHEPEPSVECAAMSDKVRFEEPPVREVVLAILFEPMEAASVLDLAEFRLDLASTYPHAEELAPLPPWEGVAELSMSLHPGQSKWPMPMCVLANATRELQVHAQSDRLGISWTHGLDAPGYPGFTHLFAELERAYASFLNSIHKSNNPLPIVKRVIVRYTNLVAGVSPDEMAKALLLGWPVPESGRAREKWTTSIRMNRPPSDDDDGVSLLVLVDPDSPEDEDENKVGFADSSVVRIGGDLDINGQEEALPALERIHAVLLRRFLEFTSDEMARKWGRI